MKSKLVNMIRLARLDKPIGYLLCFYPASFGLMLAYESTKDLLYLIILLMGSISARSAGCIINDLFDQDFDRDVRRTKDRPLAKGLLTDNEAILLLSVFLCICLALLLTLNSISIIVGALGFIMIIMYPLMKRITNFPQIFLGLTFSIGSLIGYSIAKNSLSFDSLLLYLACIFWIIGYDTIYAFMDVEDDKKISVKSIAILLENRNYKLTILSCYVIFLSLIFYVNKGYILTLTIILNFIFVIWMIHSLDIKSQNNCLMRFKMNNYIGFSLLVAMLLENTYN